MSMTETLHRMASRMGKIERTLSELETLLSSDLMESETSESVEDEGVVSDRCIQEANAALDRESSTVRTVGTKGNI